MRPSIKSAETPPKDSLSVELGSWFKAHATGRGVIAIPLVIGVIAVLELIRTFAV